MIRNIRSCVHVDQSCNIGPLVAINGHDRARKRGSCKFVKRRTVVFVSKHYDLCMEQSPGRVVFGDVVGRTVEVRHHAVNGISEFRLVVQTDHSTISLLCMTHLDRERSSSGIYIAYLEPAIDNCTKPLGVRASDSIVNWPFPFAEA